MSGFGLAAVKAEGTSQKLDPAAPNSAPGPETFWLEICGTREEFAALRHALTSKRNPFVRKVALAAQDIAKGIFRA